MITEQERVETTVREIEKAWGHGRDEWGLLGPAEIQDDEEIRFTQIRHEEWESQYVGEEGEWVIERFDEGGEGWYVASDERFASDDIDALRAASN